MNIATFFFILLVFLPVYLADKDPYEVLGVTRTSSPSDIKKAYKNLAKEWHPDKNQDPNAENKFIEINRAYGVLSDPERKALYDKHGIADGDPSQLNSQQGSNRFFRSSGGGFFGGFQYEFRFDQGATYHKQSITAKTYSDVVLPTSNLHPYLILFYSDWCLSCLQAEVLWKKIVEEMEPAGMRTATVHAEAEHGLAKTIGVNMLPFMILVLDGQVYQYKEQQLSFVRTIDFVKSKIPYKTVVNVEDDNVKEFLGGWTDNRVRVLLFSKRESIRLRYLLVAFQFRKYATFGHVQLGLLKTTDLMDRFHITASHMETLLIFNEGSSVPVASLSMNDIPIDTMSDVVSNNRFLLLPRLSSQDMFDQLCPPEASRIRKRLCVVLVTQNVPSHEPYRQALREFLEESSPGNDRVRYVYIFADRQTDFVRALSTDNSTPTNVGLVVLWRKNNVTLQYQWLKDAWFVGKESVNISSDVIHTTITDLLQSNEPISADAVIQTLVDEHTLSVFSRMILKLVTVTQYLRENVTRDDALPAISVLFTIGFVVIGSYFMSYLVKLEEEAIAEKFRKEGKEPPNFGKKEPKDVSLSVHELRGETYNGLIRLLKPGCRTIVLLVDTESKLQLLPIFYRACHPYRKNKSLMFAFLMLEKNVEWYRRLLIQTLAEPRELNINTKNCIGTVLSLNGHRKYFCMYHKKYQENIKRGISIKDVGGGEFMGFEDTSDSSETEMSDVEAGSKAIEDTCLIKPEIYSIDRLLDGLSNWLDRLFEGSTQRYYIKFWPRMK